MEMLLQAGLSNALVASVLAAAVAGVSRFVRRPALVHSLWLLVLLKLITPPLWSVPVPLPSMPAHAASAIEAASAPEPLALPELELAADTAVDFHTQAEWEAVPVVRELPVADVHAVPLSPSCGLESVAMTDEPSFPPADSSSALGLLTAWPMPSWPVLVLGAWAAGSLFWIGLAGWRIARFGWLVRQAHSAPSEVLERVEELSARLGIPTAPQVGLVRGCVSPLLWALSGAPRLLLPAALWDQLDDDQRDALLVHELAHLRRRDHWIRNLELVVTALYWWHPVVWWARRSLREAEEQCCDAWVVWAFPKSARAYATALLQTVDFLSGSRSGLPAAASGLGHLSCLKRRLIMIMQEPMPRALSWAGRLSVLGLAAVLLPVAPSWAQRPAPEADQVQQQAGRVVSDDDDNDDGAQSKEREEQIAQARVQVKRMESQLNEQRANVEAKLQKAQSQLENQMKEAHRALAEAQEKLQQAVQRVVELEQGKKGERINVERRVKVFTGDPKQFKFQFDPHGGFGPDIMPDGEVTRIPGKPGEPDVFVYKRQEVHTGPGTSSSSGSASAVGSSSGSGGQGQGGYVVKQGEGGFKMIAPPGGGQGNVHFTAPRGSGAGMGFGMGGMSPQTEQRLSELEKKLDRLLEEVAKMKKSKSGDDGGPDQPARR